MTFEFPASVSDAVEKDRIARVGESIHGTERGESVVITELNQWLERCNVGLAELRAKREALVQATGYSSEAKQGLLDLYDRQERVSLAEISEIETTLREQEETWRS